MTKNNYYPQKYLSKLANYLAKEVIIGTFSDFHIVNSFYPFFPNPLAEAVFYNYPHVFFMY